jgi:hypothetical protein
MRLENEESRFHKFQLLRCAFHQCIATSFHCFSVLIFGLHRQCGREVENALPVEQNKQLQRSCMLEGLRSRPAALCKGLLPGRQLQLGGWANGSGRDTSNAHTFVPALSPLPFSSPISPEEPKRLHSVTPFYVVACSHHRCEVTRAHRRRRAEEDGCIDY